MAGYHAGIAWKAAKKSNPNLIADGKKRVEQFAENERDRQKRELAKNKIRKLFKRGDN